MSFKDNLLCESYVKGKQAKSSFKSINDFSTQSILIYSVQQELSL